ncbi:Uncharacterized protein ChrSV_2119 [Chromobacterium vaccinii]|nr:Uncharacterized protein ChrSW_2119 [Chromobacterium vaccinii]QND89577.1 Uncharacterized protein ChrSV_2119 [Chromobacterium vaccinii]
MPAASRKLWKLIRQGFVHIHPLRAELPQTVSIPITRWRKP